MAKKRQRQTAPPKKPPESRTGEVATVVWMLAVTTTLLCISLAGVVWIFARDRGEGNHAMLLAWFLHFSSIVTAVVSLALTGVVLTIRREPPPRSITLLALIVALLPILAALL